MASKLTTVVKSFVAVSVLALSISACCGCGWDCAPRGDCHYRNCDKYCEEPCNKKSYHKKHHHKKRNVECQQDCKVAR